MHCAALYHVAFLPIIDLVVCRDVTEPAKIWISQIWVRMWICHTATVKAHIWLLSTHWITIYLCPHILNTELDESSDPNQCVVSTNIRKQLFSAYLFTFIWLMADCNEWLRLSKTKVESKSNVNEFENPLDFRFAKMSESDNIRIQIRTLSHP